MDPIHPVFATRDALFYDHPKALLATSHFVVADDRDWSAWSNVTDHQWAHWSPRAAVLPDQGWKVHISATLHDAPATLRRVSQYCHAHELTFKFLRDDGRLTAALAKDADRRSAGKFITIYPANVNVLEATLNALDQLLDGLLGPHVLSDLRWRRGPLHVRYGAFFLEHTLLDGELVPAIRDGHTGRLVPDVRAAEFVVPSWVDLPDFLVKQLDELDHAAPEEFPQITGALLHSNAGGVYTGRSAGRDVVVKEARPWTGVTPDGRDAITRLAAEEETLRALPTDVRAPRIVGSLEVHGHRFLVMERIPGRPLSSEVVARNPLGSVDANRSDLDQYRDWALQVIEILRTTITKLHAAGRTHGDLHPGNVLIDEQNNVTLIDFEMSAQTSSVHVPPFGVPGFVTSHARTPVEVDEYALACIELHMFLPLTPLLHLDRSKASDLTQEAAHIFGLSREWATALTMRLRRGLAGAMSGSAPADSRLPLSTAMILRTLMKDATPDREDRLWAGDPRQFRDEPFGLAHGATGVALALHAAGSPQASHHADWIHQSIRSRRQAQMGLMTGVAGAAVACMELGWSSLAEELQDALSNELSDLPPNLYEGSAGVGLAQLHGADALSHQVGFAHERLLALDDHWRTASPRRSVQQGKGGLLHGASGTALLALNMHAQTNDPAYLAIARRAIDFDLHSIVELPDGSVHVNEGWRTLPYLGHGSAGIGLVLAHYLQTDTSERYARTLGGIIRAAQAPFTAQAGLFQGRAGLIYFLGEMQRLGFGSEASTQALKRHVDKLQLHALRDGDDVRFVGDGLLRASNDVASGSAGILLALTSLQSRRPLPWLSVLGVPVFALDQKREGGEVNGVPTFAANTGARRR